jgi:hypothetical protein
LGLRRHPEVREDEDEDEEIVDAEGELDEIAGVVLQRRLGALPPENEESEEMGEGDEPETPAQRLLEGQHV